MRLFLGWSGAASRRVANVLRSWIPTVIQAAEPFVSAEDLAKGRLWLPELSRHLAHAEAAILCVVPDNRGSPWLCFEAGALSAPRVRATEEGEAAPIGVTPFLVGLDPLDLEGPLGCFQATVLERDDVLRLCHGLNAACGPRRIPDGRLALAFGLAWPGLRERLAPIERELRRGGGLARGA